MTTPGQRALAEVHWALVAMALGVGLLGIYNLHSAAAAQDPNLYLVQLAWFGLSLCLALVVFFPDYRITEGLAYPFYAVVCLLLVAVLLQGKTAGGARRWLALGPLTFQPSELAKLAVVLAMARYFSQRWAPEGYSLGSLFRPLNPSRPLACLALLIVCWRKPWLVDPVGQLARSIYERLGGSAPVIDDLLWFRLLLVLTILAGAALAIVSVLRWEKQQALLNPWPTGRRNRMIGLLAVLGVLLLVLLGVNWHWSLLVDPFGVALRALYRGAAPGGLYAQPASGLTLRIGLALIGTVYLAASLAKLRHQSKLVDRLVAPIDLLLLPALLILVEPDLGTAGLIILIGMTVILVVGVRLRSLLSLAVWGAAVAAIGWFGLLKDYQKRRILTFIDPEHDLQGAGWNAVQSLIAVGSGRWFGKGHRGGTQTQLSFLPEQHTDFAFSVWAEETGFVGALLVLLMYAALLVTAFAVAADARDRYGALLATGVAAIILWQALINIGMVIGVFPVVGLTLPLFSYGGSSLLTVVLGIGLLVNVHWRRHSH